jgi:hypothetical protein
MNKPHRYKPKAPLHPVNPGPTPLQHISTDMIAPLPDSDGFNAILVIVDKTSKKAVFVPTNDTLTSQGFAELLLFHWIRHFGLPLTVTSDRGPQFVNKFITVFYESCGIKGTPSTAYLITLKQMVKPNVLIKNSRFTFVFTSTTRTPTGLNIFLSLNWLTMTKFI